MTFFIKNKRRKVVYKVENKYCIYIHTNKINNKKYVGITKTSVNKRWGHNGSGYIRRGNTPFARAIKKYGWDNFEHEVVADNLSQEEACNMEVSLIKVLNTCNRDFGYNIQQGGQLGNAGVVFSEESRQKMRDAKVGKKLTEEHKNNISKGCMMHKPAQHTPEGLERLRIANIGKVIPEETRRKISESLIGITRSEETRQKMSDNHANKHPVYCPQMDEYFDTISDVTEKYGVATANIGKCLKGIRKSAGKHPITGEKLTWESMKKEI